MKKIFLLILLFSAFKGHAQYDSMHLRQSISAYGYDYKTLKSIYQLGLPTDTIPLAARDSGSVAWLHNILYTWDGSKWGSSKGLDSATVRTLISDSTAGKLNKSDSTIYASVYQNNQKAHYVPSITSLENYTGNSNTVIVQDSLRGGTFNYVASATPDSGTVFNRYGGGYWQRNYKGAMNSQWFGGINAAITGIGAKNALLHISQIETLAANTTIPANVAVEVLKGGSVSVPSGDTLTINGTFKAGRYTVFPGSGVVNFGTGSIDAQFPEWDGAKADGTTNGTHAFAVEYVRNVPISLAKGTYLIDSISTLNGTYPLVIEGQSQNNSFIQTTATSNIAISIARKSSISRSYLSNFTLLGTSSNKGAISLGGDSSNFIYCGFTNINNVGIENFTGTGAYGIQMNQVQELQVNNCLLEYNYYNILVPNFSGQYLTSTLVSGKNSYIGRSGNRGVCLLGTVADLGFQNIIFESNQNEAIYYNNAANSHISIKNCYFEQNSTGGTGAISITGGSAAYTQTSVTIDGCSFHPNVTSTIPQLRMNHVFGSLVMDNTGLYSDSGIVIGSDTRCHFFKNATSGSAANWRTIYTSLLSQSSAITADDFDPSGNWFHIGVQDFTGTSNMLTSNITMGNSSTLYTNAIYGTSGDMFVNYSGGSGGTYLGHLGKVYINSSGAMSTTVPPVLGDSSTLFATTGWLKRETAKFFSLKKGSVVFMGANGLLAQDTTNFYWDDINKFLGLGTVTPVLRLTVLGGAGNPATSGTSPTGVTRFTNLYNGNALDFGFTSSSPTNITWMQSYSSSNLVTNRTISFNPNGGRLLFGTLTDNGIDEVQITGTAKSTGKYSYVTKQTFGDSTSVDSTALPSITQVQRMLTYPAIPAGAINNGTTATIQATTDSSGKLETTARVKQLLASLNATFYADKGVAIDTLKHPGHLTFVIDSLWLDSATRAIARPYKVYTAIVNQTGTAAPTVTVLENTTGATFTWGYVSAGSYTATASAGVLTSNKTTVSVQNGSTFSPLVLPVADWESTTVAGIKVSQTSDGTKVDSKLSSALFEIRIYP